ncbi:hypothetical protein R1T16_13800 [Flavobacterium sp. DG1-102-2]|uniref:hypothetical protein n=1 Tax=Flavobacterium sp. DG1-102-2 TaxID=3081663 RepID=UPI00294A1B51|nr:hypothetical protein [Flavobacterium sp. DG1-102-2]MDV6169505.1 hypothetical protein [Flavobacterium sp. DG1-102-2]
MKKIVLFLFTLTLLSCSGSDDSSSVEQLNNNLFKINSTTYGLTNANINRQPLGDGTVFFITLTNAEVSTSADGTQAIVADNLTHLASFTLVMHDAMNQLPTGTFNFKGNYGFDAYSIQDNIVVEGGKITSRNVVSNESDLINQDARIIITKTGDTYNFNFNLTTSLGIIQGQYTGSATKNY